MSNEIKAGVILRTKFIVSGAKSFREYINYIDREAAVRNKNYDKFNLFSNTSYNDYHNYMENPEKSTGLFTASSDVLSEEEKKDLKRAFTTAQQNGSPMWQTVISFDNRWLSLNGLYDLDCGKLNERRIRESTRLGIGKLLEKENLAGTARWSASIHYNTDNIHVHVAIVEPYPTRKIIINQAGEEEYRGKIRQSSMREAKSAIVNNIIQQKEVNIAISNIIRLDILQKRKSLQLHNDARFTDAIMELYQNLPDDKRLWRYNTNAMKELRPLIDRITDDYLSFYHADSMRDLTRMIEESQEKYRTAYGQPKSEDKQKPGSEPPSKRQNAEEAEYQKHTAYYQRRMDDLHTRMGNALLSELREFDKEMKSEYYRHVKTGRTKEPWKSYRLRAGPRILGNALAKLKRTLGRNFEEHMENQRIHYMLDDDLEYSGNIEGGI